MRRLVIGIVVAFTFASAVPAVAHEPPFSWTGFYVGVNAGYSWGTASGGVIISMTVDQQQPFRENDSRSGDMTGWLAGGQVGYNWQSQRWVYGIEADFQGTGQDGQISLCLDPELTCANARYQLDWFGTLRARVGYLLEPRALLYLAGGLAYGHISAKFSASDPELGIVSVANSETKAGWVLGGGLEWALNKNWMLRAEYLYMDLGSMRANSGPLSGTFGGPASPVDVTVIGKVRTDFTDEIFRLGVSYKFGDAYGSLK